MCWFLDYASIMIFHLLKKHLLHLALLTIEGKSIVMQVLISNIKAIKG